MSNAVIGALRVNLGLDAAQFTKGLKQSQSQLAVAARQMRATLAVVGAAAAALTAAARMAMNRIDAQAKAARRLDASVDAYRALQIAAGEAGVSVDALADTAQRLSARLVDAERAGTPAAKALARLGLDARALRNMDADARIAAIADSVKRLGLDSGETTRMLRDLGITNREMTLLVMQGGEAIREARRAVDDYGLSLSDVDVAKIEAANDAWGRIGFAAEAAGNRIAVAFAPAMQAVAQAFTNSMRTGGALRETIEFLGAQIQRMATYAATFAAFMGARYVAALVAARVATFSLAAGLVAIRAALIRTGIGALVVLAGEVAFQISKAAEKVDGFGKLLGLVADVAREAWDRIGIGARAMGSALYAVWNGVKARAVEALDGAIDGAARAGSSIVNTFRGAYAAIVAVWQELPRTIGDLVFQAAGLTGRGIEAMINKAIEFINGFLDRARPMLEVLKYLVPSLQMVGLPTSLQPVSLGTVENPYAGAASAAMGDAAAAFAGAFASNPLVPPDTGLSEISTAARAAQAAAEAAARALAEVATAPMTSIGALVDAFTGVTDETERARAAAEEFAGALGDDPEAGGGGGGGVAGAAGAATTAIEAMENAVGGLRGALDEMKGAFQAAFVGIVTGAKNAREAISELLKSFANMLANKAFTALWGSISGALFGGGASPITAGIASFEGGGFTGPGARSGGLDGKGGRLAILHPNETVLDHTKGRAGAVEVRLYVDQGGNWQAAVERVAGAVVAAAAPQIIGQSVQAVGRLNRQSLAFATGRNR